jgi:hypothetical protein
MKQLILKILNEFKWNDQTNEPDLPPQNKPVRNKFHVVDDFLWTPEEGDTGHPASVDAHIGSASSYDIAKEFADNEAIHSDRPFKVYYGEHDDDKEPHKNWIPISTSINDGNDNVDTEMHHHDPYSLKESRVGSSEWFAEVAQRHKELTQRKGSTGGRFHVYHWDEDSADPNGSLIGTHDTYMDAYKAMHDFRMTNHVKPPFMEHHEYFISDGELDDNWNSLVSHHNNTVSDQFMKEKEHKEYLPQIKRYLDLTAQKP